MTKIKIGDAEFSTDGRKLTITRGNKEAMTVALDKNGIDHLLEFVTSLAESEFNRRQTFRVAVWSSSGLLVQLRRGNELIPVRPTSLSISGIFVELAPEDWIDLAMGDELEAALEFEGETHTHRVIVRHCDSSGYGLQFSAAMSDQQIDRLPEITNIVMTLQRRLLARHKRLAGERA